MQVIDSIFLSIIQTLLTMYFIFQIGTIKEGNLKNTVMILILGSSLFLSHTFNVIWIGSLLSIIYTLLFSLFYDEESFYEQWKWILAFNITIATVVVIQNVFVSSIENSISNYGLVNLNTKAEVSLIVVLMCIITYLYLVAYRKILKVSTSIAVILIYSLYGFIVIISRESIIQNLIAIIALTTFFVIEKVLLEYNRSFKRKTSQFQQDLLLNQYEEIKGIYLNMRGFRHDYHNHIQVIKAHLNRNRLDLVENYLLEIEKELERIDASVRSGNMMVDAILNSKISIAEKHSIEVVCKAQVPEKLGVTDIELCVILGNLLDNAIESCQKIEEGRFIRVYMTIIKNQFYISIQNSAKEDLNFNEKNYITNKRGNHGLGMKRVKLLIDKYDGYLNLQNEPGIFASEVTIPFKL